MPQAFIDIISKQRLAKFIGIAGVERHDNQTSKVLWRIFTSLMLIVAFWLLIQWQIEALGPVPAQARLLASSAVWLFFLIEFITMVLVTSDKKVFLKRNWLLPLTLILGVIYIYYYHLSSVTWLRDLQPILALCIMLPSGRMLIWFFRDGKLGTTLFASAIIVIAFGLLVAGIDPNIKSPWDGVWWAIATVSTVGYGDVVPTSALGRLIGTGLIVMGLGMFVIITANFLAIFLQRETKALDRREKEVDAIVKEMQELKANQEKILEKLDKL